MRFTSEKRSRSVHPYAGNQPFSAPSLFKLLKVVHRGRRTGNIEINFTKIPADIQCMFGLSAYP